MKFSDLTEQQVDKICKVFAIREGINVVYPNPKTSKVPMMVGKVGEAKYVRLPSYPNSLDAMHCIIEGLKGDEPRMFIWHLHEMVGDGGMYVQTKAIVKIIKATCQQQFVAAALALGLIKEGANHE